MGALGMQLVNKDLWGQGQSVQCQDASDAGISCIVADNLRKPSGRAAVS